jgi:hypothetical protein
VFHKATSCERNRWLTAPCWCHVQVCLGRRERFYEPGARSTYPKLSCAIWSVLILWQKEELIEYEKIASWDSLHEVASDDDQNEWQWQQPCTQAKSSNYMMHSWLVYMHQRRETDCYMNNVNVWYQRYAPTVGLARHYVVARQTPVSRLQQWEQQRHGTDAFLGGLQSACNTVRGSGRYSQRLSGTVPVKRVLWNHMSSVGM